MGTLRQIKQHDTGLPLIVDLNYRTPTLDLTSTITLVTPVVFIMTAEGAPTPTINRGTAAVTNLDTVKRIVTVTYQWQTGDTATAGRYVGEFEFALPGGVETAPTGGYLTIDIYPDLG